MSTRVNSLIPRANRKAIYETLFKAGTLCVKKDPKAPRHSEIEVPNLHVMMTMRTLKSKNYVQETYNWRYFYYVLNNEGVEYLREQLQLPSGVDPQTHHAPAGRETGGFRGNREEGDWGNRRMGGGMRRGGFGGFRGGDRGDFGANRDFRGGDFGNRGGDFGNRGGDFGNRGGEPQVAQE